MKKVISITISILLIGILIERLYFNYFANKICEKSINKEMFLNEDFRLKNGLPTFNLSQYKLKSKDESINMEYSTSEKTSYLKQVNYYCHSNSEKDVYQINDTLKLKCRIYFSEPISTRFILLSTKNEKQISIQEAYSILLKNNLINQGNKLFYGFEIPSPPDGVSN